MVPNITAIHVDISANRILNGSQLLIGRSSPTIKAVIKSDSVTVSVVRGSASFLHPHKAEFAILYPVSMWFSGIIKDIVVTIFTADVKL